MGSALTFRSPRVLTVIGVCATLVVTTAVVVVLLRFGGGAKAVSDNAALLGGLIALGGVFTTQLVNISLEDRRAEQARKAERTQRRRDRKAEQAQRERELAVAQQRSQDEALQAYLDQMGELLLNEDRSLYRSTDGDPLQTLARSRTLAVLSTLDGARKGNVVQFLYESGLITKGRPVVNLAGADLSEADLSEANLADANLSEADLGRANLGRALLVR